jgi:tRNA threonylcarbamoyladenosine biosynthesis protein TsaE
MNRKAQRHGEPYTAAGALSTLIEERTESTAATMAVGARLADHLKAGDVVSLVGPLGAGKTTLVRGLLRGLGYEGRVRSPSFTLLHDYATDPPVRHADLFRLEDPSELVALGLEEELEGVLVVEWADRVPGALEEETWRVDLTPLPGQGEDVRLVSIRGPQQRVQGREPGASPQAGRGGA